jgi:DNA-directed RNA polymerase delta subunit
MIRKGLSKSLHTLAHGFEWSATQCHVLGDKALNLPKWMDLKTDEAVAAIQAWNERQEAQFQARTQEQQAKRQVAQDLMDTLKKAAQEAANQAADAAHQEVKKVSVQVL